MLTKKPFSKKTGITMKTVLGNAIVMEAVQKSNHLDEIGFLMMILLTLVFSFLIFYFGLPTLLDKFNITPLAIFF